MSSALPMSNPGLAHRPVCKYGRECYQKNPMHHEKFQHPTSQEQQKENQAMAANKRATPPPDDSAGEASQPTMDQSSPLKKSKMDDDGHEATQDAKDQADVNLISANTPLNPVADPDDPPELPASPMDMKANLKQKFLMDYPPDFYCFWQFCQERNRDHPELALVDTCGLRLTGPFDVLAGAWTGTARRPSADYLAHARYFYDPPEFQTVLASADERQLFHIGYFRDDPAALPDFVASNDPAQDCRLNVMGDNLFAAVYRYVMDVMRDAEPFRQTALEKLKAALHVYTTMKIQDHDFSLDLRTPKIKSRERRKVATTFQGVGLVVPYNKETQVGYREIPETTASLKRIFKNINEASTEEKRAQAMDVLQELMTNVQFANDEGDPGMSVELGLNAFATGGPHLHGSIEHLLGVGYELMDRPEYAQVIRAHLKRRNDGGLTCSRFIIGKYKC
ncbi:hypothetical protein TCAL_10382 [Tigriopus californicus]|uniref:PBZ-type domain-containing protein n=1 Tax=Tigriopus californicus TaxID=6832 RepID=A0A553P483_TIGCA|nr:histone PARylation factor 1-like [Tigriopus californicus]TRY72495.1 hypothetical protein TCAL_10382 [Tigriopus californicus]